MLDAAQVPIPVRKLVERLHERDACTVDDAMRDLEFYPEYFLLSADENSAPTVQLQNVRLTYSKKKTNPRAMILTVSVVVQNQPFQG